MRRSLLFVLASFFLAGEADAIPLRPKDLAAQKKGVVNVKVRRIEEVKPADTTAPPPAVALRGEHRLLVVLVETADQPWPTGWDASRYRELVFDRRSPSMREYFRENSYGAFDLTGDVVGPIRVPGRMADYAYDRTSPDGANVAKLIRSAVEGAGRSVKLSSFDTHDARGRLGRDGVIDHVLVVYAESTGRFDGFAPIWPHRGSLDFEVGGLRVQSYLVLNHAARLGVFVHEFGHDIGLPDLYDRDYTSYGAGDWCLMASGSWAGEAERPVHMSAWAKMRLGWLVPEIVSKPRQNLKIPAASERPFALKIPIGDIDAREYFLVENRRRVGFDSLIPAEGLLVWHIDEGKGDNDDEKRKLVDVVEATKVQDLDLVDETRPPNYLADVFTGEGNSVFDDASTPSARSNSGEASQIRLRVLTPAERVMAVDIDRPEIFNPGGVPYVIAEDGYTFGRFATVPLGKGSEALMRLEATQGGYVAFAVESFVSGNPGSEGRFTVRLYADQSGKPGKVLATERTKVKLGQEPYAWARVKVGSDGKGLRLGSQQSLWVGLTSEDEVYPALNPFSTTKRARFRVKSKAKLEDAFNFREGRTPVSDYVLRLSGFGFLDGTAKPEPLANDADELIQKMRAADARADRGEHAKAMGEYEVILASMEKDPRKYESWIPVLINSIGVMAYEQKKYPAAIERFEATLRRAIAAKDDVNSADVYQNLGETSFFAAKLADTKTYCDRSRELNAKLGRFDRLVENLYWLGRALDETGDDAGAKARYAEADAAVARAFAKDAKSEAEWTRRIALARAGTPEDKPKVAERTETMNDGETKKKQKATYTDLLQFLEEDATEE